jgi:hypothetical protein
MHAGDRGYDPLFPFGFGLTYGTGRPIATTAGAAAGR